MSHLDQLVIEGVNTAQGKAIIKAKTSTLRAVCPECGAVPDRVHGRYRRRLADVPLASWPVVLDLQVRRFRCTTVACTKRTFVEQVDGLTRRFTRRSMPLTGPLAKIGLALAGRAVARVPCQNLSHGL